MTRLAAIFVFAIFIAAEQGDAADAQPPGDPHQQLEQILQGPMYQRWRLRQDEGAVEDDPTIARKYRSSLERISEAMRAFIDRLLGRSTGQSAGPPVISGNSNLPGVLKAAAWAVVGVAVIVAAALLLRLAGRTGGPVAKARILSRQQVDSAFASGDALALASGQWMEEGARLAAKGDYRAVYRALYLALLSGLHSAGKIDFNRNRTNWTYVQQYRGPGEERTTFSGLTELFDRVWYGLKTPEETNLDQLMGQVAELTTGAGGRGGIAST